MYRITTTIRLNVSNITIEGDGFATGVKYLGGVAHKGGIWTADFSGSAAGRNIHIKNMSILSESSGRKDAFTSGVLFSNVTASSVENANISGWFVPYPIWFRNNVTNSRIHGNVVTMPFIPDSDLGIQPYLAGIEVSSEITRRPDDPTNCHKTSAPCTPLPATSSNVSVTGNTISRGRYGIQIGNTGKITVSGNTITSPAARGIYLGFDSFGGSVTDNRVTNAGSTALVIAYGVHDFEIAGNYFDGSLNHEGTAIEGYFDVRNINIHDNQLRRAANEGILIGLSARDIQITNNTITNSPARAGIAVYGIIPRRANESPHPGVYNITIQGNQITLPASAPTSNAGILVDAGVLDADDTVASVTVSGVSIRSNNVIGGACGLSIKKNPSDASTPSGISYLDNRFESQTTRAICTGLPPSSIRR